jgi:Dyp-type peroxidase family
MTKLSDRVPLDESNEEHRNLLTDLQCNILSSHGRSNTHYFFLRFSEASAARRVLRALATAEDLTKGLKLESEASSRHRRLARMAAAKQGRREHSEGYSTNLLLSSLCYTELLADFVVPPDEAFKQGLAARDETIGPAIRLNDPPAVKRAPRVHALYTVAYDVSTEAWETTRQHILGLLRAHQVEVHEERGYVLRHPDPDPRKAYPIEPFGYRDAISQPLFFQKDLEARVKYEGAAATVAEGKWSSFAPLSLVLTPDPNGGSAHALGSYVCYRKIKQKVAAFYEQAARISEGLRQQPNAIPLEPDEVADRLIGRHVDGEPLDANGGNFNDFKYPANSACPMHAHVRKVNPRDQYVENHRIVRRATVFGPKLVRERTGRPSIPVQLEAGERAGDVGLLFFCCQANIAQQFEWLQGFWANQLNPVADTVIGQVAEGARNFVGFNGSKRFFDYDPVVEVMEGEYFFAPSISFLASRLK